MAEFLERRMVLGSKVESSEGTANAPVGADCNLLVEDVKFEADIDQFDRKPLSADLSPYASIAGMRKARLTCKIELKGSGTAGTAPAIGKLLKACGMSETLVAVTSATYAPLTLAVPTLTIDLFSVPASGNNIRERMVGARGTYRISAKVGQPVYLEFTFQGAYAPVTDQSALTPSGLETILPQAFLSTAFSMHALTTHKVSMFNIDMGNSLAHRTDISLASGVLSCLIIDRKPTFSFDPEKELVTTHDYYGKMLSNNEGALSVVVGATAGNICTITAPKCQYTKVTPGSRDGIGIFNIDGKMNRSSGNDELVLAFT
jgi:hypothetical protein